MAHRKGKVNGRNSPGKRLGIKCYGKEEVHPGVIILRQRGTQYYPGIGVKMGKDHTIFAITEGKVAFSSKAGKRIVSVC